MSRSRARTSRVLMMILGLAVAVGVGVFGYQYRQNRAIAAEASKPAPRAVVIAPPADADILAAAVTSTPIAKPTTTPASGPTAPTTRAIATTRNFAPTSLPSITLSSKPLVDAKAKADAGKVMDARDIYNAALLSEKLSAEETRIAKEQLAALNEKIVFSPTRFEADPWGGTFTVPPGGAMAKIAKRFDVTPELLCKINGISDPRRLRADQTIKVIHGPLHAVVDKSDFTLDVYFGAPGGPGSSYITTLPVGLGKDDSTPTGTWLVEPGRKLTNPTYYSARGEGIIEGDDPKNPLGEYWIGLTGIDGHAVGKMSYGIHGTIEPDSIGTMASQGCIRLRDADIARVYQLLVEGKSTVRVQD